MWIHVNKPALGQAKKGFDANVWSKRIGKQSGKMKASAVAELRADLLLQLEEQARKEEATILGKLPAVVAAAEAELLQMSGPNVQRYKQLVEGVRKAAAAMARKDTPTVIELDRLLPHPDPASLKAAHATANTYAKAAAYTYMYIHIHMHIRIHMHIHIPHIYAYVYAHCRFSSTPIPLLPPVGRSEGSHHRNPLAVSLLCRNHFQWALRLLTMKMTAMVMKLMMIYVMSQWGRVAKRTVKMN